MNDELAMRQAARWQARLQAHDCSDADRLEFERWRRADPAHARAYDLSRRVSADLNRLVFDPRLQALADEALQPAALPQRRQARRWGIPAAIAASVIIGLVALRFTPEIMFPVEAVAYSTSASERRTLTLEDGSTVALDVDSQVLVRMSGERRHVELVSGRALFDVAHDASRPFSVTARGARTTALGTRFQVQHGSERVIVTLEEGSVAVEGTSRAARLNEQLRPGEQLSFHMQTAAYEKRAVDPQAVTSWTRGRHVFRGTPLADVVEEVNRYAARKVRLGDPTLATLPVGGNFIAGDSESIVAALAAALPLRAVEGSDRELILFRRYTDASAGLP